MNTFKSNSDEQQYAENIIFDEIEKMLGITLTKNPRISLSENTNVHIQPDFYSEEESIVGEIFSHIGKYKGSQPRKIANDILKMVLLDKAKNKTHKKLFVVCRDEEKNVLENSSSWLSECIRQFDVEVIKVDIPDIIKEQVLAAQKRQIMING